MNDAGLVFQCEGKEMLGGERRRGERIQNGGEGETDGCLVQK